MKKLLRLIGFLAVVAAIVWLTREHLLPKPQVPHEPPPHYRSTPPPMPESDDLTAIKGIGPVYAARLAAIDVVSFQALATAEPEALVAATGASPNAVAEWIAQARNQVT